MSLSSRVKITLFASCPKDVSNNESTIFSLKCKKYPIYCDVPDVYKNHRTGILHNFNNFDWFSLFCDDDFDDDYDYKISSVEFI